MTPSIGCSCGQLQGGEVSWKQRCISSHSLSILVNGCPMGGQDSPSKGDQAGLSAITATTCPSCQCTRYMYEQSLFTRHTEGLPDDKLLKGHPHTLVCR